MEKPLVFDIARCSFVDGPGIRTTVFLKACPLHCEWCHNPESISPFSQLIRQTADCRFCMECRDVCAEKAISFDGTFYFSQQQCNFCGKCESVCRSDLIRIIGKYLEPDLLAAILCRDKVYYDSSGGGVTFSGGEPLIHIDYLSEVCSILKKQKIHIAVQTAGHFNFEAFEKKLGSFVDLIYFDLKIMDPELHMKYTRRNNKLILKNLVKITESTQWKVIVRTPLIPGKTDSDQNLKAIRDFIDQLNIDGYETLENNPFYKSETNIYTPNLI